MITAKTTAEKLARRTARHTTKNHLIVVVEPTSDGTFNIDFSGPMSLAELEAAAHDLLLSIHEEAGKSSECACCEARSRRAGEALKAMLEGGLVADVSAIH